MLIGLQQQIPTTGKQGNINANGLKNVFLRLPATQIWYLMWLPATRTLWGNHIWAEPSSNKTSDHFLIRSRQQPHSFFSTVRYRIIQACFQWSSDISSLPDSPLSRHPNPGPQKYHLQKWQTELRSNYSSVHPLMPFTSGSPTNHTKTPSFSSVSNCLLAVLCEYFVLVKLREYSVRKSGGELVSSERTAESWGMFG